MNMEATEPALCGVTIEGYADGVYNVTIAGPEADGHAKAEISKEDAEHLCDQLGVELPDPEPSPPEQWG